MDPLLGRLETLELQLRTLQQQSRTSLRRLRWWRRLACTLALLTMFSLPLTLGAAQDERKGGKPKDDQKETLKGLLQRFLALERKLQHVTSEIGPEGFPELVITGANLRVVNGLGETQTTNGLGNVIVGYNEPRGFEPDIRTGSHNVVVGVRHNFFRVGGLVVGLVNTISGDFAAVSGGVGNTASGFGSSVSGGLGNTASFNISSVSGGEANTASGFGSSVSGGVGNTASGFDSAVSGGVGNTASGFDSSVSGGVGNTASGNFASVSGGLNRAAEGESDWVAGGVFQDE
jgi:hypothetical protein